MKKVILVLFSIMITILLIPTIGIADNHEDWSLVWSDEFNGNALDTSKWTYDIGNGVGGWGNNEEQYYTSRPENVRVQNGSLVITALNEQFNGFNYTSGKLKTDGLASWKYGKFEARIKLPIGQGFWPAFWMMPQDDIYGGWASSGEIDIMENRGRLPQEISGAIHYGENWPNNVYSGGAITIPNNGTVADWHNYSVEWEPGEIRWYLDGQLYNTETSWYSRSLGQSTNNPFPAPFDQEFYMILNLAVGGNFDGGRVPFPSDFPAEMLVDYVRVYESAGPSTGDPIQAFDRIEAENYTSMSGIQTETTTDTGGGLNVGWTDEGDFLAFNHVDFGNGASSVDVRVASNTAGGEIEFRLDSTSGPLIGTVDVTNTGGWQNWITKTATISNAEGIHDLYIVFKGSTGIGILNLNWLEFTNTDNPFKKIEAESYTSMIGVQTEPTTDLGGGLNVGWTDDGDLLTFENVDFGNGATGIEARVATESAGGSIEFRLDSTSGPLIGTVNITNTGGWQNWVSETESINATSGSHDLYLVFRGGSNIGNLNWFKIIN
ncbi:carbohydrate-binding protein [Chengkuizengella sediminis]|uniref:carbohydrate-binding protein n=1 Tax=Chengkuizengella sediminis TaxID=1885917 RepID=UPI001389949A|nr:carbohydrate-binding protein [Chengkuizengella sediminis]NDI35167.1 carbohydrate-binding protein [Chengkuizengella sediminis]